MRVATTAFVLQCVLLATASASAEPVEILNSSFEDPSFTGTLSSSATGTNWNFGGGRGRYNLGHSTYSAFDAVTGNNVAYANGSGNNISQVLSSVLEPNSVYTYSIYVGSGPSNANNGGHYNGYELELEVENPNVLNSGGNPTYEVLASVSQLKSEMDLAVGEWIPVSFMFESGASFIGSDGSELMGEALRVRFSGGEPSNFGTNSVQTIFDDISLTVEALAVPEPATLGMWMLLGMGCATFLYRRRRRRGPG